MGRIHRKGLPARSGDLKSELPVVNRLNPVVAAAVSPIYTLQTNFLRLSNIKFGKTRVSDARKVSLNAVKVYIYLASFLTKFVISHPASHIHFS